MQLLSDTRALGEAFLQTHFQLLGQSMQVKPIKHEHDAGEESGQYRAEPPRLPQCGLNLEADNTLRGIPCSIAITGQKVEMVRTRAQIGVNSFACSGGLAPLPIEAFQKISKANPLRYGQAQGGICECDSFVGS